MHDLKRSNKELEQFAYVASHDLQEPLRMVSSFTQLLARRYAGQLDEKADTYINYAVDGANRMQQLINDLLSYSRVGTQQRDFSPTNMEHVLEQALHQLQKVIAEHHAQVTHDPLPVVHGMPSQLVQLLQNLISNAIKFCSKDAPRVHICVEEHNDESPDNLGVNVR
jgi:chemotaxis family two-component system sensor kinase Cph1